MTFAKDSPIAVRVVPAPDNWTRNGAVPKGIYVHMAEGGGTVSWLTRNDGNSSHYVVEYDGDCVQMVDEERAAGSVNPNLVRKSDDPAYTYLGEIIKYGRTAVATGMGTVAGNDPNRYGIAIEVEGFAATGPNAKQRVTLARLISDIRRRKGALPVFGHRDFQSYKACPGHKIPWVDYGGHGRKLGASVPIPTPPPTGGSMAIQGSTVPEVPTRLMLRDDPAKAGRSRWLYVWSDHRADVGNKQLEPNRFVLLTRFVDADTYAVAYEPAAGDTNATSLEMFVHSGDVAKTEPVPMGDEAAIQKRISDAMAARDQQIAQLNTQVAADEAKDIDMANQLTALAAKLKE